MTTRQALIADIVQAALRGLVRHPPGRRRGVAADNAPAQALYHGTGWRESGRRRRYYGPDLDAIVMALTLEPVQQGG